jgi:hypothetical protein
MTWIWNPVWPPWAIGCAVLLLLLVTWLGYRILRLRNIPNRWAGILLMLRLLAVLVFALCLLRPTVRMEHRVRRAPDLLVLVDRSASMAAPAGTNQPARWDSLRRTLTDSPLATRYLSRHNTHLFVFDRTVVRAEIPDLARMKPDGATTRMAAAIQTAWSLYRQQSIPDDLPGMQANRVLLLSDGLDRDPQDPAEVARALGLAVDVLEWPAPGLPSADTPPAITAIQAPVRILQGAEGRVRVTLAIPPASGATVLRLIEGEQEIVRQDLPAGPTLSRGPVELVFTPTLPGTHHYQVRLTSTASPVPFSGEAERPFSVTVPSLKNEVLFLDDAWRWDFKFLRRVMEDDPAFALTAFLSRGTGLYQQFGEPDRQISLGGFPQSRTELGWFDIFILGDTDPRRWPRALAPALRDLVVEEGKSLLVIAGPRLVGWADVPELAGLLPVEMTPETAKPLPGPIAIRLRPESRNSAWFFAPTGQALQRWADLPPVDQIYPVTRKRPAAQILLEASGLSNANGPLIVLAEHTVGRGRVLFLATDTLWKWQMAAVLDAEGNTPYLFFWQQALRALQPIHSRKGNQALHLETDRSSYQVGAEVRLKARLEGDKVADQPVFETGVTLPDGQTLPLNLLADPRQPGVFQAVFEAALSGAYTVRATGYDGGRPLADAQLILNVVEAPPEERAQPPAAMFLANLAQATGGMRIDPQDPATWPPPATAEREILVPRFIEGWALHRLLLLLVVLLGADWLIRLIRGYV